ncbi:MAG: maleylpyruvate isomerase family mycothiol-dependent enzyme, partial [Acidimicrobiales bacterium]
MAIDPNEALRRADSEFSSFLERVTEGKWSEKSVCEGWAIGDLVDHVIGGNVFTTRVLEGATVDQAMESAINAAIAGQQDRKRAYKTSMAEALAKLSEPGIEDRTCHHIAGEVSGEVVRGLRVVDVSLHSWDLARSLGLDDELDSDLVESCWAVVTDRIEADGESS